MAKAKERIEQLEADNERLAVIVRRIYAEKLPNTWFVCGEGGPKDTNGLPRTIHVCPAYGCDWTLTYVRRDAVTLIEGE